jgi:hypothetical protein
MRYMMLIYNDQAAEARQDAEQRGQAMAGHSAFAGEMRARGILLDGNELHPAAIATTIRVRGAETLNTDGPYAETREQLGGYYILECADLDEAIECAAKIPTARVGSVEIRPIVDFG